MKKIFLQFLQNANKNYLKVILFNSHSTLSANNKTIKLTLHLSETMTLTNKISKFHDDNFFIQNEIQCLNFQILKRNKQLNVYFGVCC